MLVWKYEGLGNDFVLVTEPVDGAVAAALCHRSLGVGADGVLVVDVSEPAVHVWNSDGSAAELCGNGLRCVALHLTEKEGLRSPLVVGTGAGPLRCEIVGSAGPGRATVEVEMGRPRLERRDVPVDGEGPMVEEAVEVAGGRVLTMTAVGMGNPHAVTFDPIDPTEIPAVGPAVEHHTIFPAKVNAGFATVHRPDHIELTVWERGAGLTGACGSGACAAAVAACVTGRAEAGRPIVVSQPGGELTITVDAADGPILMRGPARRVFEAEVDVDGTMAVLRDRAPR